MLVVPKLEQVDVMPPHPKSKPPNVVELTKIASVVFLDIEEPRDQIVDAIAFGALKFNADELIKFWCNCGRIQGLDDSHNNHSFHTRSWDRLYSRIIPAVATYLRVPLSSTLTKQERVDFDAKTTQVSDGPI